MTGDRPTEDGADRERPAVETDGAGPVADPETHTIRMELADEPGTLLAALEPIADNGGNLLSIYHDRRNTTPRGYVPVEVAVEATPDQFDAIVAALRAADPAVTRAGTERYGEHLTLVLVGHLVDTDLSDSLERIERSAPGSVVDLSLSAPEGTDDPSSARLQLATRPGGAAEALRAVRSVADEKGLTVVEPLAGVGTAADDTDASGAGGDR